MLNKPRFLRIPPTGAATALLLLVVLSPWLWRCGDDLCASHEPGFEVTVTVDSAVDISDATTLEVSIAAGTFVREATRLPLGDALADRTTSFDVVLGDAGDGGFAAQVVVDLLDRNDKRLARGLGWFPGSGDACNFFTLELSETYLNPNDQDGDGVVDSKDCQPLDPCIGAVKESPNFCAVSKETYPALPAACVTKLAAEGKTWSAPYCGDGVDQDCDGSDRPCLEDNDCDGVVKGPDCDDNDKAINPAAVETCDRKDNNCNGSVDEGCHPCDVDGDKFATMDKTLPSGACSQEATDPDDYDSGIAPDVTKHDLGFEGGTRRGALRNYCSKAASKNSTTALPIAQRDVDHDGDGKPASADGCPTSACDADGDGFPKNTAACTSSRIKPDCDDSDPRVFPGAPEICNDGKGQACGKDIPCIDDKGYIQDDDGDGYRLDTGDDCDDYDKTVHPWAVEVCDGKDNDCDGLVDEGNPDTKGALISTLVGRCSDDKDGECSPACTVGTPGCGADGRRLTGLCVCSPRTPIGHQEKGNRVACGGEDFTAHRSPRCFAANQPSLEECDHKDHDCDGYNIKKGQNFKGLNKSCGIANGSCKVGLVSACHLDTGVVHADLLAAIVPTFKPHWVCKGAVLPIPEVCNGRDDDCDGAWDTTESDGDMDGYLGCTGCTTGNQRTDLDNRFRGCGDCVPDDSTIHPGAKELCNGKDDDCDATTADGKDQCAAGTTCCGAASGCVDVKTDAKNCGKCGVACSAPLTDSCVAGQCRCGTGGAACKPGQRCLNGTCVCDGQSCNGCCSTNLCVLPANQTVTACGLKGATCAACTTTDPCKTSTCRAGVCTTTNKPLRTVCTGGRCVSGVCCKGCIDAYGRCSPGTSRFLCGNKGENCRSCGKYQCINNSC